MIIQLLLNKEKSALALITKQTVHKADLTSYRGGALRDSTLTTVVAL
jgi:hypothetical protein